jgi:S-adenosylmethionine hydrolase
VGPDNGLLVAGAERAGGGPIAGGVELAPAPGPRPAITFDGRDLFAPAVAALCRGVPLEQLGLPLDPATLQRLPAPTVAYGRSADGRHTLQAEITWVDRFGNLQLAATPDTIGGPPARLRGPVALGAHTLRGVETFADLAPAELGLLLDANGQYAVVARQASAAQKLALAAGDVVVLTW